MGNLYKLLAKVLANRLKKVLSKVIPESQNAFMEEGRQFLDVVLINNEAIDSMLKRNTGCFVSLILRRRMTMLVETFLFVVLNKMGFGQKWISWCIFSPKFFFIVNGTPLGFFESSRGLRQGDLLSSYLFVLAMETLNCLLERAREGGFLLDLKVNGRVGVGLEVSHVLFTNDMVVFCEASITHLTYLSWLLMWFEFILGLKINLTKSELILVRRVENLEELAVV